MANDFEFGCNVEEAAIPGWPGYFVTPAGDVWSRKPGRRPVLLRQYTNPWGYAWVGLKDGRRRRSAYVHRLVLESFVGPPEDGQQARHIDGDNTNNHLVNLAWGTHAENIRDKVAHGKPHPTKLTPDERKAIRERYHGGGTSYRLLALDFGVSKSLVAKIVRGTPCGKRE